MTSILGDIVCIRDSEDGLNYYAQILSIVTDEDATNYITPIWLLPIEGIDENCTLEFNPVKFEHGIIEREVIPLNVCYFEASCPLIPRYRIENPGIEELMREKVQRDLRERVVEARSDKTPDCCRIQDELKVIKKDSTSTSKFFKKELREDPPPIIKI